MAKIKKIQVFIVVFSFFVCNLANAQKTATYHNPIATYHDGLELFQKEKYGSAQEKFRELLEQKNIAAEMKANAAYYNAACALSLFNNDAATISIDFITNYPENPKTNRINYLLADYYFKNKKYDDALKVYEMVAYNQLSDLELAEYYFKKGYCYFIDNNYEKAKISFHEITTKENKYYAPANYYFAHITYLEKNYETALGYFKKLLNDENYGKIAPYYLLQIYYYQQKYDEIILLAPTLLDAESVKRSAEISRITAEAYYQTERYAEALPHLEMYINKNTQPLTRSDNYMIAYTYYKVNDCQKALKYFNNVSSVENDSLFQLTNYHMAECYLKLDQKQYAVNMFAVASKMSFDKAIQQNALFNYAKLTYETAYNPYNDAINAFTEYIGKYPNAANLDEAYEYLSNIYLSTKNYKDALTSLDNIKKRSPKLNTAYQKIAYYRGIELFNNTEYTEAIAYFEKSLRVTVNENIESSTYYWMAEAYYRLEDYDEAIKNYQLMLTVQGADKHELSPDASYGLGYCFFKKKNYGTSLNHFAKYAANSQAKNLRLLNDAYNRMGDCYFIQKEFAAAQESYEQGIQLKKLDVDYALYQKALAQGAMSKLENKAATLINLIESYKTSSYRAAALFELAGTYQNLNNNSKSVDYYEILVREYPSSSYVARALVKKGLIYYNESKDEQALQTMKKVVSDFPATTESKEALLTIRNIYVDLDRVEDFLTYVKTLPFENISNAAQDSITYIAVENRYMKDDCVNASAGFKDYIKKFPQGVYMLDARFYLAECQYRAELSDSALANYLYVINKPRNKFTETSLLKTSEIYHKQNNCNAALGYYEALEKNAEYKENALTSLIGQMRCNYQLALYQNAIINAKKILAKEKISEDLQAEAHLTIAKSAMNTDSSTLAMAELVMVTKTIKNEKAAEATYLLAEMYFKNGNYVETEKALFDLINQYASYDYWLAKSFILLADNYLKTNNIHQAKYTLKSIIENYDGADLIKIAQEKLNKILEDEKIEEQRKAEEMLKNQNNAEPILDININQ